MYDYDRSWSLWHKQAALSEATEDLLKDASFGPGPGCKAVASAKPANPGKLTSTQERVLGSFDGAIFGYVSKALVYDSIAPHSSVELRALASLMKGGLLVATKESGGIPGARASRVGAQGPYHYVLQRRDSSKQGAAKHNKTFESYIALAADNLEKLRKSDVFRVLSEAKSSKELTALSAYILDHRQDLKAMVTDDAKDVADEKGW